MAKSLRIAVGDLGRDAADVMEKALTHLGHSVVSVAQTGRDLVEHCRLNGPDFVVVGVHPPWPDGLKPVADLFLAREVPVIAYTGPVDPEWADLAVAAGVFAHLVKPVTEQAIGPAVAMAWLRWEQFQALKQEAADLKQALEDRKVVERAKGVIMRRVGGTEEDAYRRLRKSASDRNLKLVETARQVLAAEDVFRDLDR